MPQTPEEAYLTENAGQLGLRLWLEPTGDVSAANDWKNDRYVLIPDGEASSAVMWDIELNSKESADRFEASARARIAAMAKVSEKRHLSVSRPAPARVRLLNTATPGLAAKFN
jgi:hypothetical protein